MVDSYIKLFSNLSVKISNGQKKPNKAIMLLSVIDLIRCGYIFNNKIFIDDTLYESFCHNWKMYINSAPPTPWTPYWHLKTEPFWHFCPVTSDDDIVAIASPGETASVKEMKRTIQYAYLDSTLFSLLQDQQSRDILQTTLIERYIKYYIS